MLPKRFFLGVAAISLLIIITGCSVISQYKDPEKTRYLHAQEECIRYGHRRGSYDYNRCMDKRLEASKKDTVHENEW